MTLRGPKSICCPLHFWAHSWDWGKMRWTVPPELRNQALSGYHQAAVPEATSKRRGDQMCQGLTGITVHLPRTASLFKMQCNTKLDCTGRMETELFRSEVRMKSSVSCVWPEASVLLCLQFSPLCAVKYSSVWLKSRKKNGNLTSAFWFSFSITFS